MSFQAPRLNKHLLSAFDGDSTNHEVLVREARSRATDTVGNKLATVASPSLAFGASDISNPRPAQSTIERQECMIFKNPRFLTSIDNEEPHEQTTEWGAPNHNQTS